MMNTNINLHKIICRTFFFFFFLILLYQLDIVNGSAAPRKTGDNEADVRPKETVGKPKPASAKAVQNTNKRKPYVRKAPIRKASTNVRNRHGKKLRRTFDLKAERAFIDRINAKLGRNVAALNESFSKLYYKIGPERLFGGVTVAPYKKHSANVIQNRHPTEKQQKAASRHKDGREQRRSKRSPAEGSTTTIQIPKEFDLRKYHDMLKVIEPHNSYGEHKCHELIARPSDQSACGCCYAVTTADMLRDRLCIAQVKQKRKRVYDDDVEYFGVSAADILACSEAGDCDSGSVTLAVDYARKSRVVSGGPFHATDPKYCFPFPYPDVRTHNKGRVPEGMRYPNPFFGKKLEEFCQVKPKCPNEETKCPNSAYKRQFGVDKYILGRLGWDGQQDREAKRLYGPHVDRERQIQIAILEGGPVVATIESWEDLRVYQHGQIYEKADVKDNARIGDHAVRIVGWGEVGAKKYWLCSNSVGPDWGDNGFFRIVRGQNMVGIEQTSIDWLVFHNVPEACTADKCEFDEDGYAKFITKTKH